jgi:hypothetical protein
MFNRRDENFNLYAIPVFPPLPFGVYRPIPSSQSSAGLEQKADSQNIHPWVVTLVFPPVFVGQPSPDGVRSHEKVED